MTAMGMYLNLLPVCFSNHSSSQPFVEAITDSRTKALAALAHSKISFDIILDRLSVPRSASHSPLFQAFIDFRHGKQETRPFGN
nr:polyketide synthase-nonribosomal peptide synthetase [Quercus suber]